MRRPRHTPTCTGRSIDERPFSIRGTIHPWAFSPWENPPFPTPSSASQLPSHGMRTPPSRLVRWCSRPMARRSESRIACDARRVHGAWAFGSTPKGWKWCCRSVHDWTRRPSSTPSVNTRHGSCRSWRYGISGPWPAKQDAPATPTAASSRCWVNPSRCAPCRTAGTVAARCDRWEPSCGSVARQPTTTRC